MSTTQLSQISSPTSFLCSDIRCEGEESVRLKRMGICSGRLIEVIQAGDPMVLGCVGSRIGISRQLAACVEGEVVKHTGSLSGSSHVGFKPSCEEFAGIVRFRN